MATPSPADIQAFKKSPNYSAKHTTLLNSAATTKSYIYNAEKNIIFERDKATGVVKEFTKGSADYEEAVNRSGAGKQIENAIDKVTEKNVLAKSDVTGKTILNSVGLSQKGINEPRNSYPVSYYPTALQSTKQDRIKFEMRKAGTRNLPRGDSLEAFSKRSQGDRVGEVYLAVPNQISDSNSADWSNATMNPIQMQLASLALGGMRSGGDVASMINQLGGNAMKRLKEFANQPGNRSALQVYLAQEAAGTQGLLSRLGGVIANPNVELLFNGPSLRPFTFVFKMSPRDDKEAIHVKQIIRFFKEGMAVQTTDQDIFLKSPNVFNIQFQSGNDGGPHRSLPRIKTCALVACDIDYTPDGSYMTFNDPDQGYPMTSYQMTLRFNELEPVYASDYKRQDLNENDIGF